MKHCLALILLALGLSTCWAQQQVPPLDTQSVDSIDEPKFLQNFNPLTLGNLDEFFSQWAEWSIEWANTHHNPICDSLYQLFFEYKKWEPKKHQFIVLPAVVKMTSFDTFTLDDFMVKGHTVSAGNYVPHLPGVQKVYYVTPSIHELLMEFVYQEKDLFKSDENNERIEAIGHYIDKPLGMYLSRFRFESRGFIPEIYRVVGGTVIEYTFHGISGDTFYQNDVTGEFEGIITWD